MAQVIPLRRAKEHFKVSSPYLLDDIGDWTPVTDWIEQSCEAILHPKGLRPKFRFYKWEENYRG